MYLSMKKPGFWLPGHYSLREEHTFKHMGHANVKKVGLEFPFEEASNNVIFSLFQFNNDSFKGELCSD